MSEEHLHAEIRRLQKSLKFLTTHIPGASEIADDLQAISENGSVVLETNHVQDAEAELLGRAIDQNSIRDHQEALDEFRKKRLNNMEVGRLYERYIGYRYEQDGWKVTFKGAVDGFDDLGRDLICTKGDEHLVVQAKCWSRRKKIPVKYVHQLHASTLHYKMSLRKSLQETLGRRETKAIMSVINKNLKSVLCTTTGLSEEAEEIMKFLKDKIIYREEPLNKDYPMIKCNINKSTKEKLFYLPFDSAYDTIIIGNEEGEQYVNTVQEAVDLGFRHVGA